MSDTFVEETPLQQPNNLPARIRTARVLSIITTVLSAIGFLLMAFVTYDVASLIPTVLSDPELAAAIDGMELDGGIAELGFGGLTSAQAIAAILALVVLFVGFAALISLVSLVASICAIRSAKNASIRERAFGLGLVGGVTSIITLRVISGILLIIASLKLRKQHIEEMGGHEAYYADGKRLGFMRFVEFACIAQIIMNVTLLLFVTKSESYDGAWWINFVMLLMMAVTYWVIWNRREHGCKIICGMVAAYLVINLIYYLAIHTFNPAEFAINSFWPVVMLLYFGLSKHARYTLVRPLKLETRTAELKEEEKLWNPKSPAFWRNLVLYFCIFSVVGHWMEWSVCWLIRWGIIPGTSDPNSGIWHDMLNPFFVSGAAVVIISIILFPTKNWLVNAFKGKVVPALLISFAINTLFCAAIELALGLVANTPPDPVTGKLPLWDYQDMAFNFMGQICLLNTTFFGVMATLMTWLVYPALEKAFSKIPKDVMNILTVVIIMFFVLVVCMYVINLDLAQLSGGMITG